MKAQQLTPHKVFSPFPLPPHSDFNAQFGGNFSAPLLLQHISSDFTISALISSFSPNTNYQGSGIILLESQSKFLRLEVDAGGDGRRAVTLQEASPSKGFYYAGVSKQRPTTDGPIELSIQKQGDHFTAWWSVPGPGQNLQLVGDTYLHYDNDQLMAGLDVIADFSAPRTTVSYGSFMVSCHTLT